MLEITEIFDSLQGEGPFMGRPAVFVRLSGCVPPFCPWCDTVYARNKGAMLEVRDVAGRVLDFNNKFVVITGGEPFLQWASGLHELEKHLLAAGCSVQYETSGKLAIPLNCRGYKVCSPKFLEGTWQFVETNVHVADIFKFVVADDFKPLEAFVKKYKIPRQKVWVMPLGASRAHQLKSFAPVWEYCVEKKFNFAPRLHVLTFDRRKGI